MIQSPVALAVVAVYAQLDKKKKKIDKTKLKKTQACLFFCKNEPECYFTGKERFDANSLNNQPLKVLFF